MSDVWAETSLGEVLEFCKNGKNYKEDESRRGLPITRIQTIAEGVINLQKVGFGNLRPEDSPDFLLSEGDILFSHINSLPHVGKVAYVSEEHLPLIHGMNLLRMRFDKTCDSKFMFFLMQHSPMREKVRSISQIAVNQVSVNITNLKQLPVLIPALAVQKRIADLISSVDFYINALQKKLETVNKSKKALLEVLLKAGGDNWIETTIGEISQFISIRTAPDQLPANSIYVGLEHLESNITSINNFDSTSKVSSSLAPFDVGDVLFGRLRPYLHKVALAEIKGFCSPEILVLRANSNVLPQMLLLYCDADSTIKACVEKSAGTRMPRTSSRDLASIKVKLPPIPQQEHLADLFGTFHVNIARLNQTLDKTRMIRAALLSDLLSGEYEIPTSYDKVMDAAQ